MTNIQDLVDYELPNTLGINEYIHSYLVEHPRHYYLVASRTHIYYLDRRYGLMEFHGNYHGMTHQDITDYIVGSLEMVTNMIEEEENRDDGSDFSGYGDDGA